MRDRRIACATGLLETTSILLLLRRVLEPGCCCATRTVPLGQDHLFLRILVFGNRRGCIGSPLDARKPAQSLSRIRPIPMVWMDRQDFNLGGPSVWNLEVPDTLTTREDAPIGHASTIFFRIALCSWILVR
jgi:hypothetical protein